MTEAEYGAWASVDRTPLFRGIRSQYFFFIPKQTCLKKR